MMFNYLLKTTRITWLYLQNFWFNLTGDKDYRKFVVITRSRTGSNYLITSLNSHPQISAKGEVFKKLGNKTSFEIWNSVFSRKPVSIKYVGFKLFYYHPIDGDDRTIWDLLLRKTDLKIIHLKRENLLRTVLSSKIAQKTNVWIEKHHNQKLELNEKRVALSAKECMEEFEQTRKWEDEIDASFASHDKLNVSYENMVSDNQTMIDILEFLGVEQKELAVKRKRQNSESLEELILNYDEFYNELKETKWLSLLESR